MGPLLTRGQQLGLHLTDHHIRVALYDASLRSVVASSIHRLAQPLTELKKNQQLDSLSGAFAAAVNTLAPYRTSTRRAVLAIGDEEIFIKILTMPTMPITEAKKAVPHELEPDLPLKADHMYTDATLLGESSERDKMDLMVFAASRDYIDSLTAAAESAGLHLQALEITSAALGRLYAPDYNTYVTVDLGSAHGTVTIFENDLIHVTTSLTIQNEDWDRVCHDPKLRLTPELVTEQFGTVLGEVADKITTAIRYYNHRVHDPHPIEKVFLSGSGGRLPHLDRLLTERAGVAVVTGRAPVTSDPGCDPSHMAAIGAALRNTYDEY